MTSLPFRARATTHAACGVLAIACAGVPVRAQRPAPDSLATKRSARDVDEPTDTHDTIDWVLKQVPRVEPRVGTWGNSAPGFFVTAGLISGHPAHVAAYPS